jgi:P4 family phage/plasmid primase-like protien
MTLLELIRDNTELGSLGKILENKHALSRAADIAFLLHDMFLRSPFYIYSGDVVFFNGRHYEFVRMEKVTAVMFDVLREAGVPNADLMLRGNRIMDIATKALDKKEFVLESHKIGFTNGVYDVDRDLFSDFSPEHHIISCVGYDYDPDKTRDVDGFRWNKFLDEVLPDKRTQRMLQEFLGMLFVDRRKVKLDYMLFLVGRGKNGKSVIFHTLSGVLGAENITNYDIEALTNSREKLKNIAEVNGMRLNYCSDISSSTVNSEAFKSLVSGEPQPARKMWGDPFIAYNIPFMIGNGNRMPSTRDFSDGFFRRVLIVPFNVSIPDDMQDRQLPYLLTKEYSYIFNWIIDGLRRVRTQNYQLTTSLEAEKAVSTYKGMMNNIFQWIEDRGFTWHYDVKSEQRWYKARDLYQDYVRWCESNEEYPHNNRRWGEYFADIGFEKKRLGSGICYLLFNATVDFCPDGLAARQDADIFRHKFLTTKVK